MVGDGKYSLFAVQTGYIFLHVANYLYVCVWCSVSMSSYYREFNGPFFFLLFRLSNYSRLTFYFCWGFSVRSHSIWYASTLSTFKIYLRFASVCRKIMLIQREYLLVHTGRCFTTHPKNKHPKNNWSECQIQCNNI